MATPRKQYNHNYRSPYAKPVQQYPSQSTDFVPFYSSGVYSNTELEQNAFRQQNDFYRNPRRVDYRKNGNGGRNRVGQNRFHGQGRNHHGNSNRNAQQSNDNAALYFHNSMLEDPWKDLMQRYEALSRSIIDEKCCNNDKHASSSDEDESMQFKNME